MDTLTEAERKEILKKSAIVKIYTLTQILKCIDIASARGAYKPSEMTFVGSVYDTLSKGVSGAFESEIKKKQESLDAIDEKDEEDEN